MREMARPAALNIFTCSDVTVTVHVNMHFAPWFTVRQQRGLEC